MVQENGILTAKQQKVIEALLESRTHEEAAEKAGVNRKTLYKYLKDPVFRDAYREARLKGLEQGIGRLQAATTEAVNVLTDLLNDEELAPALRLQAAKTLLELAFKATEYEHMTEIEKRLEALEGALNNA